MEIMGATDFVYPRAQISFGTRNGQTNTHLGEKMTITKILYGCTLFAFAVAASSAQTKNTISGTCTKADVEQSVPAGDTPDHVFMVAQGKCAAKGKTGGETAKEGAYSEHRDVTANRMKAWGVFVETYDSGDKIIYDYQISMPVKDGKMQTGKGTYSATEGTGKLKGIRAKGTCTYTPGADDGVNYSCTGDYTIAKAMAAK